MEPLVPVFVHTRIVKASAGPAHGASAVSRSACRMPGSAATLPQIPVGWWNFSEYSPQTSRPVATHGTGQAGDLL